MYNAAATLSLQLDALTRQTYRGRWEVLLADNGSSDDSVGIGLAYADRLPGLRAVAAGAVRGVSHARNAGVEAAAGDFVAICDADDLVDRGWLAGLCEAAPNGDVLGGVIDLARLNGLRRYWQAHQMEVSRYAGELPRLLGFLAFAPGGNFGAWRSVILDVGGWDERLVAGCDDVDFSWRAQLAGYRVVPAPAALVSVRTRATAVAHARQSFRFGVTTAQLFANYRGRGAKAPQLRSTVRTWAWLLATLPDLLHEERRGFWIRLAATRAGRLVGSVRHRVLLT